MTALLGYCDKDSVAPGETVRFMVSCIGAERYRAEVVRLINPQAGPLGTPFRTEPVDCPANGEYAGRRQAMYCGSFGVVDPHPLIAGLSSFTVQAMVWPTTPGRGRQALLGTWSESEERGFGLGLDETGALVLRLGDGRGDVATVSTGVPLLARRWYFVAASFDAGSGRLMLHQEPLADGTFHDQRPVHHGGRVEFRPAPGPGPFLFAAWHAGEADHPTADGGLVAGGFFNGRIDRPRLANRALSRAEMAELVGGVLPAGLEEAVVASWDLALDIPTETLTDTSPNRLHGRTVNLPTRAVTGHNWSGAVMDWTEAPGEYGAIHFHDDDLVDANWQPDFELTVPAGMRSGVYAARLTANEAEFYVPFFVRPPRGEARSKVAYLAATATYIAYINNRGRFLTRATELYHGRLTVMDAVDQLLLEYPEMGLSTYDRHSDGSGVCYSSRLRPATNVKPFGRHWNFNLDLFI
ncbi:MAG TPA: LamG domain-containing protein, partial [Geminicoccaceae bacterium]|nr:LamG domain-containing protein [Geminicoccaceae bacterium]